MNFFYYLKIYLVTFVVFLGIDAIWLAKIAPNFYKQQIGHLMAERPDLVAAAAFYLVFIAGMVVFAIAPALEKQSFQHALVYGALYGFMTYATYDLTNLATLKEWPVLVTIVDLIWGTVLSASVAYVSYSILIKFAQ